MNADFSDRTYTAEVMKSSLEPTRAIKAILGVTQPPIVEENVKESGDITVRVIHSFLKSERAYHRSTRTIKTINEGTITIPRQTSNKGKNFFLYDVFIAVHGKHIVIAVPFHQLAEDFFLQVDRELAGTQTLYERLDITKMVIGLGASGITTIPLSNTDEAVSLSVTRCHLAYTERDGKIGHLKQVQITGPSIGSSHEYQVLVSPVLKPSSTGLKVTPTVLGFALSSNGVRKSSATTDRHGNFKLWVAPGLRRLTRLFGLLESIEAMGGVTSTTSNVPILQSKNIRDTEE